MPFWRKISGENTETLKGRKHFSQSYNLTTSFQIDLCMAKLPGFPRIKVVEITDWTAQILSGTPSPSRAYISI